MKSLKLISLIVLLAAAVPVLATAAPVESQLPNISIRGLVGTGDDVMIVGFIIGGSEPKTVLIRGRGPVLKDFGLSGELADPFLQLFSGQTLIAQNDNWQVTDPLCGYPAVFCGGAEEITATGLDPCVENLTGCAQESAILLTLPPGPYTVIMSGAGGGTGVGLVEVFEVNDLLVGAVDFTGPFPEPADVSFTDSDGQQVTLLAFPGQVQVFFNPTTSEQDVLAAIQVQGGQILAKIPLVGYYLVGVAQGQEESFITVMDADSRIDYVAPHIVGVPAAGATILDQCGQDHADLVEDVLITQGGTFDQCRDIDVPIVDGNLIGNLFINILFPGINSLDRVTSEIIKEASENGGGTTLMNLSSSVGMMPNIPDGPSFIQLLIGGNPCGPDFLTAVPSECRQNAEKNWLRFMRVVLASVAALPQRNRNNFVITIAAGNINMPIDGLMNELRSDSRIADILRNNVLVVTSNQFALANDTGGTPDVAIMTNPQSAQGTSFAAPAALAIIQKVMLATGASARIALQAVKLAVGANSNHLLILEEAIDRARSIVTPVLLVSTTSLDFGTVEVGSSITLTFTVTNDGGGTLTGSATTSLPFSIVSGGDFTQGLGALVSQTVTVRFSPISSGTFSGSVSVNSNGGTASVSLTGTGEGGTIVFSGEFSGETTADFVFCKFKHSVSGRGNATAVPGLTADTFTLTITGNGEDVITPVPGSLPECTGSTEAANFQVGPILITLGQTIDITGSVDGGGTARFVGTLSNDLSNISGTLTINNPVFDSPIVGPLTMTRQ